MEPVTYLFQYWKPDEGMLIRSVYFNEEYFSTTYVVIHINIF